MNKLVLALVLTAAALPVATSPVDQPGSLAGVVLDDRGQPVRAADVEYHLLRGGRTDRYGRHTFTEAPVAGWVTTGNDGRFLVTGLRSGQYMLCALAKLPHQLHSCQWGEGGAPLRVNAGQQTGDVRLVLRSGVSLTVHVADPIGIADPGDVFRAPAHSRRLLLGVISDTGEYYRIHNVSKGQGEFINRVAVPRGRAMKLVVDTDLDVGDAAGNPMASGKPRPITEPEGPDGVEVHLSVRPAK